MKIILFRNIGDIGMITEVDELLSHKLTVEIDGADSGSVCIADKKYSVRHGRATVPETEISEGEELPISFTDTEGREFACGVLIRSGRRYLHADQNLEACIIACCREIDTLRTENKRINADIRKIKSQYGITIV